MNLRLLAVAAALFVTPAAAQTSVLATVGAWSAFGGKTEGGDEVCGVSLGDSERYFGLKLFGGEETFTIQAGSNAWKIADMAKVAVVLRVDNEPAWTATATGFHFKEGDAALDFEFDKSQLARFMTQFRGGRLLRLRFDNGTPDWTLSLSGSNAVSDAFLACVRKLP